MIVLIDNYDSFTHNLFQYLAELGGEVRVVRNDKITVEELIQLKPKAIVLSPGPGRPENAGICVELIQKMAPTTPILGICLGHQAIGLAFGGKVVLAPEIKHGKKSPVFHCRKRLFKGIPLPVTVGRYHSLIIEKKSIPEALCIEAETADGVIMAVRHVEYPCFGLQFHPESILTPEGKKIVQNFIEALPCSKK